ncbi:response regulator receiver protein [Pseudomonas sp. M47T1]|uniref:response regulator n=1 Tax=Pseudomonas sp. M47T1 TaxID=1179778 RepID=UPI00026068F8|nr:response regulator [Pseudomonas sp. M47T1]EIK94018.1 response regulator receiver protein [Pseudomonas sp. M47T1]
MDNRFPLKKLVVVIEDDAAIRMLVEDMMTDFFSRCVAFPTADEGLQYLASVQGVCDLVIADYGVPGALTGADLLKEVKQRWPGVPSILTSGYASEVIEIPPHVLYLQKPWSMEALSQAVRQVSFNPL